MCNDALGEVYRKVASPLIKHEYMDILTESRGPKKYQSQAKTASAIKYNRSFDPTDIRLGEDPRTAGDVVRRHGKHRIFNR